MSSLCWLKHVFWSQLCCMHKNTNTRILCINTHPALLEKLLTHSVSSLSVQEPLGNELLKYPLQTLTARTMGLTHIYADLHNTGELTGNASDGEAEGQRSGR